jgi:hypothetical protein
VEPQNPRYDREWNLAGAGLIYVVIRTRGFRAAPVIIDFTES